MLLAPIPNNDVARLESLHGMDILSTSREANLDRITRIAQKCFDTEIALISLVDENRQWFKSRCGLDAQETGRDISFCGHAIMQDDVFVIENALEDERFCDNPLVIDGPQIRFYAGCPLTNSEGFRIGTLCVISSKVRNFTYDDEETIKDLAHLAELVMKNRILSEVQLSLIQSLEMAERDILIDPLTGVWNMKGFNEFFLRESKRAERDRTSFGLCLISLDEASKVKEEFGQELVDEVVKHAASICLENARSIDTVARYDERSFIIILPDINVISLSNIAEKYLRNFRKNDKFALSDGNNAFGTSMGLQLITSNHNFKDLQKNVLDELDKILIEVKEKGGNAYKIKDMQEETLRNLALA